MLRSEEGMRQRLVFSSVPLLALILAFAPAAHAITNLYVNGAKGSDSNNCKSAQHACKTIGRAISLASSGYTVKVAPATYKENLTIGISLNILGAGARTTIVDGNQAKTVFTISSGVVLLSGLTIENGSAAGGYASGIVNQGTLTISRCTITGNNGAGGYGGGIVHDAGTTTVSSSTITGNSAPGGYGGGVVNLGDTVTLQNTIVADSPGANCYGTLSSKGYNLSSDDSCNFNGKGDKNDKEPKLGTLGYYGGPTQTFPELLKSPTVDKGSPRGCTDGE